MINKKTFLILLTTLVFFGCSKPAIGPGKRAIDEAYGRNTFVKTMFTESMIRSALTMSGVDSNHIISGNTDYILQFELERKSRIFVDKTDSIILWHVNSQGLNELATLNQLGTTFSTFILEKDGILKNAVYLEQDSTKVKMIEFVGAIPLKELFKEGFTSYEKIGKSLNFDFFNNARNDSTD